MSILTKTPTGWNPWHSVRTQRGLLPVPHSAFPARYLPARAFWAQSYAGHCEFPVPWRSRLGLFETFLAGGGGSSTIVGSVGGLAAVANLLGEPSFVTWSIRAGDFTPPMIGYCIGEKYKEMGYIYLQITRVQANVIIPTSYIDVFQRSKLRRIYIHHGNVVRYDVIGSGESSVHVLTLDINEQFQNGITSDSFPEFSIKIYNQSVPVSEEDASEEDASDETVVEDVPGIVEVKIKEVRENYQLVIEPPKKNESISAGDFYEINTVICIEDPYMLSGFYLGVEEEGATGLPSSGKNLHITTENHFYDEFEFTGSYVFKNFGTITDKNGEVIENENGVVISAAAGSSLSDSGEREWVWIKNEATYEKSEVYGDDDRRFKESREIVSTDTGAIATEGEEENVEGEEEEEIIEEEVGEIVIVEEVEAYGIGQRRNGTEDDITIWMNLDPTISFIRMEISKGGDFKRNNWHAPILVREWVIQDDHYFKILGQPDGNVIDVSLRDITNQYDFDRNGLGKIFNQFGWFISEHFMGNEQQGIFGGSATVEVSNANSTITIQTMGESNGTLVENTNIFSPEELDGNSFYNRFRKDTVKDGGTKKAWVKRNRWKVADKSGITFDINDIKFRGSDDSEDSEDFYPTSSWTGYTVIIEVDGDASNLDGKELWVTFDDPYSRPASSSKSALYDWSFVEAVDELNNIVVCGELQWVSMPINVDIPNNSIVGVCNGYKWGIVNKKFINSFNGLPLMVTTPSANLGISYIYNETVQEDWVFYKDAYTKQLTVRTGSLGFRERPQKIEISVGISSTREESKFPIVLNQDYDRTKSIRMKMPETLGGAACTFQLGTSNDYHGFLINGGGAIDFQPLRRSGIGPGDTPIETFKYKDFFCSPCFLYHVNDFTSIDKQILFLGADTSDGPIYSKNGIPTEVIVEYVSEKQTLNDLGRFDAHGLIDGEKIVIYSNVINNFRFKKTTEEVIVTEEATEEEVVVTEDATEEVIVTEEEEDEELERPSGIFITGTANEGLLWGCPITKNLKYDGDDKYQWPLMILTGVDFETSIYNKSHNELCIISKHYIDNTVFLGAFIIPVLSLIYQTEVCEVSGIEGESTPDFLWRPPALDPDVKWTDSGSEPSILTNEKYVIKDTMVRIMGALGTSSQIESPLEDWGLVNGFSLKDGTYIVFHDDNTGLRMIFSRSNGLYWNKCELVLGRDGFSGLLINENSMFYITPFGIECKRITVDDWNNAYSCVEGVGSDFIETIQGRFDKAETILIGSGQIDPQLLAGYEDSEGVYRIFYYDANGTLACLTSANYRIWDAEINF